MSVLVLGQGSDPPGGDCISLRLELGAGRVAMPFRCCLWPIAVCLALLSLIIPNWISRLLLF